MWHSSLTFSVQLCQVEKFIEKLRKISEIEKDYWKRHENSLHFWRKSTEICRKMKDHQNLKNDFDRAGKLRNLRAKLSAFRPKMKKMLKFFQKILTFFDQNLYGKLTFSLLLLNISWISDSSPEVYTRWKITPDFYIYFYIFPGRSAVPTLPEATS